MNELLLSLKADWALAQRGKLARAPLYHQLYAVLKEAILNGTIPYEAQLPTEQQLARNFDVSRITAKRAMDELANENLIARFRGKGSHVIYQYKPKPVRAPLVGMLDNLAEMGTHSTLKVLSVEQTVPVADVQQLLGLSAKDTVHKLVRVRRNEDGEPFGYYVSWTVGITKGFTKRILEKTSRLEIIRDNGIRLTEIRQVLSAENASELVAEVLDVEPGSALLSIRRQSYDEKGVVIDILDCLYNPDRFQYSMVLSLD